MRAAVVVIFATITGILALLNFTPGGMDNFGAQASANGPQVVAVPEAKTEVSQPRVLPSVKPSRSSSSSDESDESVKSEKSPEESSEKSSKERCRVLLDGKEVEVINPDNAKLDLDVPEDGTLTIRCDPVPRKATAKPSAKETSEPESGGEKPPARKKVPPAPEEADPQEDPTPKPTDNPLGS